MIDNQLQNYLVVSQKWRESDKQYVEGWQDLPNRPRIHVHVIQLSGRLMVKIGQYLQRAAEPSYQHQTVKHVNG